MSITSMATTRRKGERKRVDALTALAEGAVSKNWTPAQIKMQIDLAVASASGLNETSKKTFRGQCELIMDNRVLPNYSGILALADEIWNARHTTLHSLQHLLLDIAQRVAKHTTRYNGADILAGIEARYKQAQWYS